MAPKTKITSVTKRNNSQVVIPQGQVTSKVTYPNPGVNPGSNTQVTTPKYPLPQDTVIQGNQTKLQPKTKVTKTAQTVIQTVVNQTAKPQLKFKFSIPDLKPFVNENILPLVVTGVAIAALTPMLLSIFPQPRIAFQKTFKIPSQECKDDNGKFFTGRVLILGQDSKTPTLSLCMDSILNGDEKGIKLGKSKDGKSFALPAGSYAIQKSKIVKLSDDDGKEVKLPFLYEFAIQFAGQKELQSNLPKIDPALLTKNKVASVGVIYPISNDNHDLIKANETALEIAVKGNSTISRLHQLNYLDGSTLVVRSNLKP